MAPTPSLFQFRLVDRLQCLQSGTVKYTTQAAENLLNLQVSYDGRFPVVARS